MKQKIFLACLLLNSLFASADESIVTRRGVATVTHEETDTPRRSLASLKQGVASIAGEKLNGLQGFYLHSTITVPNLDAVGDVKVTAVLTIKIWDPVWRKFPGWNPPFVEIFSEDKRVGGQLLKEVGMVERVWAAQHRGELYLYILTKHRHRHADGTNIFKLNSARNEFEHAGLHFDRQELLKENQRGQ